MAVAGLARVRSLPRVDRRTLLGVALAALAAMLVLVVTRPAATAPVLVAESDLPAGVPLGQLDLTVRRVTDDRGLVVGESPGELNEWTLAAPVAAGEPLLPSMLRPPQRLDAPALQSVSVRTAHAALGRLAAGDTIDIYVTWPGSGGSAGATELLARDVYVVDAVLAGSAVAGESVELLLAVDDVLAARLARAVRVGELDVVKVTP